MGNEPSKKAGSRRPGAGSSTTNTARKSEKHVHINPVDIKKDEENIGRKNHLKMEDSAHTFAPASHNITGHYRKGAQPVMITDAMGDVRVNYHIEAKELGHGHYGVVRKCMHRDSCNWYAIKSIRKAKVSKIEVLKREIEILKEVKHPHIIELIEVYEDERYLHLITELCTGGELFDRIIAKTQSAEGHFSEHDAAALVRDILDAISYCHDVKGIVHRDLKPENFLFLTDADDAPIKIIDFGLSRHDDAALGIMQTKVGTPYYVAPEVLRREYTKSCDIWSIGVITYILLCGYPPFYGDSDTQIFESVKIGKFDFPSPEWDDISQAAKDFVVSLLKKNPKDRPSAAMALRDPWIKEQLRSPQFLKASGILHKSAKTDDFTKYLAMKKLKKVALGYIASNLTHDEVGALEDTFKSLDKNASGHITLIDLDDAIEKGKFSSKLAADMKALRHDLSLSDEDQMNYRDFLAATMDRSLAMREDNIKKAFNHFRHTEADYLTQDDLTDIFGADAHARDVMELLDHDGDGKVSFEDFRHAIAESLEEDDSNHVDMK
eukprot:CAMPEP_0172447530 /NCGR_PEP_ID=MMETSP1065-20121228/6818_1 /TAXON_ID=265537 /ORGANISM="Amphiprora paludosa, Strain CCMP125" /LENGTH=549 /DNA_ID=CAMNT_0013198853 /DNA_START=56 /DNA_END=1705 /DNA_ORIENTATION=+